MKVTLNLQHKQLRLLRDLLTTETVEQQWSNGRDAEILLDMLTTVERKK